MKLTLLLSAAAFAGTLAAGNLIYNSGFELGETGWDSHSSRWMKPDDCTDPPPVVDIVENGAASGRRFIRVKRAPETMETLLTSHNFTVKPDTEYVVSFYAKSDKPGTAVSCTPYSAQRLLRRDSAGRVLPDTGFANAAKDQTQLFKDEEFKLTTEWKRYSIAFRTDRNFSACSLRFRIGGPRNLGSVMIDDVQVEEGSAPTAYAPSAPFEAVVTTDDNLYEEPKKISGTVHALAGDHDRREPLTLTLYDIWAGRKVKETTVPLDLKKGKAAEIPFTFAGPFPYGMYCIYTSLQPRTTEPGFAAKWDEQPEILAYKRLRLNDKSYQSAAKFVVVRTPVKSQETGFRLGTTGSLSSQTMHTGLPAFRDRYGDMADCIRLARLAGGNVFRAWDTTVAPWSAVEPEQGKFNWAHTDAQIEAANRAGLNVMCVIGGMFDDHHLFLPEWVRNRDRSGNPKGTPVDGKCYFAQRFPGMHYFQPDMRDWRNYVSAVATRYRGRIKYYEITNEPNLYLLPETYMEYMKAASEEIRKADPGAVILGLCSTSDFGADIDDFIGQCLKLGADKYMEHITIHPYAKLDNSLPLSQMEARRRLIGNLRKFGVKARLWNGENYYVLTDWMPATDYAGRTWPESIARHLIVDMGEGCSGSTPTHFQTLCSSRGKPYFCRSNSISTHEYPDSRFAAHSAAAYFLSGAEPVAKYDLPAGALAYTFRRGGTLYSAVWNSRSAVPTQLTLPKADCTFYDLMSNPLPKPQGKALPLGLAPYYIEWGKGVKESAVDAYFRSGPVRGEGKFLSDRVLLTDEDGARQLCFSALNLSGQPLDKVKFIAESADFAAPAAQAAGEFADNTAVEFAMPVTLKNPARETGVTLHEEADPEFTLTRKALYAPLTTLGAAPRTFQLTKAFHGKPASPQDLSAELALRADRAKGCLYLTVRVRDDGRGKEQKEAWNADGIELFLDRDVFHGDPSGYGKEMLHLVFPRKAGTVRKSGIACTMSDRPDGYDAEFEIPAKIPGVLGFDLAVNDSDGDGRKCQLVWSGNSENYKDRSGFRILLLDNAFGA